MTAIDQDLLSVDEKGLTAVATLLGDGCLAAAILNGDAAGALAGAYGGADEVPRGDVADPCIFNVIQCDGDPRVLLVFGVGGVVGAFEREIFDTDVLEWRVALDDGDGAAAVDFSIRKVTGASISIVFAALSTAVMVRSQTRSCEPGFQSTR